MSLNVQDLANSIEAMGFQRRAKAAQMPDEETNRLIDDLSNRSGRSDEFIKNQMLEGVSQPGEAQALISGASQFDRGLGMQPQMRAAINRRAQDAYGQQIQDLQRQGYLAAPERRSSLQRDAFTQELNRANRRANLKYQGDLQRFERNRARDMAIGNALSGFGNFAGGMIAQGQASQRQLGDNSGSQFGQVGAPTSAYASRFGSRGGFTT